MRPILVAATLLAAPLAASAQIANPVTSAAPAPSPPQVTTPRSLQGVPATPTATSPTPGLAGLPNVPVGGALPTDQGFNSVITAEQRQPTTLAPTQVVDLQSSLAAAGFYRGPIDGVLSGTVRGSLKAFQASVQLPATGQVDAETLAVLGQVAPTGFITGQSANAQVNPAVTTAAPSIGGTGTTTVTTGTTTTPTGTTTTTTTTTRPMAGGVRVPQTSPFAATAPPPAPSGAETFQLSTPPPPSQSQLFIQP
jgi:hypothetical protein